MLYSVKVFDLVNKDIIEETGHTEYNDALNTSMEMADKYKCIGNLMHGDLNIYNKEKTIAVAILTYDK